MSNSVRPHRQQPTRLPRPWDSPGKNTVVGFHFLLQCMKVKNESEVAQSYLTLSNPMDCSLPGSSIHGVFQAKVLEWGAIAFSDTTLTELELGEYSFHSSVEQFNIATKMQNDKPVNEEQGNGKAMLPSKSSSVVDRMKERIREKIMFDYPFLTLFLDAIFFLSPPLPSSCLPLTFSFFPSHT